MFCLKAGFLVSFGCNGILEVYEKPVFLKTTSCEVYEKVVFLKQQEALRKAYDKELVSRFAWKLLGGRDVFCLKAGVRFMTSW